MSETRKHPTPPYASFSSLLTFINKLKETTVPGRIDPSVFGNASGSLSYSIIAALKSLKFIGADGVPTPDFVSFVSATDDIRKQTMQIALSAAFPTIWSASFRLDIATAGQFDEHLRDYYDVKGSTVDKVATFFIAAANYAGILLSSHLKARKPTASSSSSRKSSKQRTRVDGDNADSPLPPPPPPPSTHHPFVQGLLDTLPKTGKFEEWKIDQQAEWLEAAAGIFRLLSKEKGRITITFREANTTSEP